MRYGATHGSSDFICVNIGTGIGTGLVIGGQLYRGARGLAGELGHIPMMVQGERCRCGGQGCLETLASGIAIAARARLMLEQGVSSLLHDLTNHDPSHVTAKIVTAAAVQGDDLSINLLHDAGRRIGTALAIAVNLFSPEKVERSS